MSTTFETLNEILNVAGKLDDTEGNDTPRERFRKFLQQKVCEVSQIQEYVEECLRNSGDQYNRALQDLVNHIGRFLGFEVTFGRYQGIKGKIGFDGYWKSPTGFHIVVEVKTTDVYTIKAATLVGYVDELISEKSISSWDNALGLYVVGRPDSELRQLENAIIGEKRTNQLRIISTTSLLSLVELMNKYKIVHEVILALLRPSGPKIDPIVELMTRLVAERRSEKVTGLEEELLPQEQASEDGSISPLTRIKSDNKGRTEEGILFTDQEERHTSFKRRSYESTDATGTKPTAVSILGQSFAVHSWRDVLERTMNTIADLKPEKFEQIMQQFPEHVGLDKKRVTKARQLKNGTFIEVNLSAQSVQHFCFRVLETIGLSTEDLVIEFAERFPQ
jgi:hypothetical protein